MFCVIVQVDVVWMDYVLMVDGWNYEYEYVV